MPKHGIGSDAEQMVLTALAKASSGGLVEAAEAQGQADLVDSTNLPSNIQGGSRAEIEASTGIVFGEDINDLFVAVVLPKGWSKKATGHSLWSMLVDDKGRNRASIFYKAVSYDRSAHMTFEPFWHVDQMTVDQNGIDRFTEAGDYNPDFDDDGAAYEIFSVKNANGETFCEQDMIASPYFTNGMDQKKKLIEDMNRARGVCEAWLDKNAPEWRSPFSYWD